MLMNPYIGMAVVLALGLALALPVIISDWRNDHKRR
jgi:hypothetical protein